PKQTTAVKYKGVFKNTQIYIYFDAWDPNNYNFQLIIHNNSDYYLTTLNIINDKFDSKYLHNISLELLSSITVNRTLDDFYIKLEDIIINNYSVYINYNKDTIYTNTNKYNPPKEELYLKTLSHKN